MISIWVNEKSCGQGHLQLATIIGIYRSGRLLYSQWRNSDPKGATPPSKFWAPELKTYRGTIVFLLKEKKNSFYTPGWSMDKSISFESLMTFGHIWAIPWINSRAMKMGTLGAATWWTRHKAARMDGQSSSLAMLQFLLPLGSAWQRCTCCSRVRVCQWNIEWGFNYCICFFLNWQIDANGCKWFLVSSCLWVQHV